MSYVHQLFYSVHQSLFETQFPLIPLEGPLCAVAELYGKSRRRRHAVWFVLFRRSKFGFALVLVRPVLPFIVTPALAAFCAAVRKNIAAFCFGCPFADRVAPSLRIPNCRIPSH